MNTLPGPPTLYPLTWHFSRGRGGSPSGRTAMPAPGSRKPHSDRGKGTSCQVSPQSQQGPGGRAAPQHSESSPRASGGRGSKQTGWQGSKGGPASPFPSSLSPCPSLARLPSCLSLPVSLCLCLSPSPTPHSLPKPRPPAGRGGARVSLFGWGQTLHLGVSPRGRRRGQKLAKLGRDDGSSREAGQAQARGSRPPRGGRLEATGSRDETPANC